MRIRRSKWIYGAGMGLVAGIAWLALAAPGWAREVVAQGVAPATQPAQSDVASLLAPMLAAAAGIERVLEMAWNWIENAGAQLVANLGMGAAWADYAHRQVREAEDALRNLARAGQPGAPPADSALDQQIVVAEHRLAAAQARLRGAMDSDRYRSLKQSISILVGIALGIAVAVISGLDMFVLLGLQPANWPGHPLGMLLTGVIVGAGTGPVHSIIGLIQQTRDAVDEAANLFNARAAEGKTRALVNQRLATAPAGAGVLSSAADQGARGLEAAPIAAPPVPITPAEIDALNMIARR